MKKIAFLILGSVLLAAACARTAEDREPGLSETTVELDGNRMDTACVRVSAEEWSLLSVVVDEQEYEVSWMWDGSVYSEVFDWLGVECSEDEICLTVDCNPTGERFFTLCLELDGVRTELKGSQSDMLIGSWDDDVQLEPEEVFVGREGGTVRATTKHDWWWFNAVWLGEDYYPFTPEEKYCEDFDKTVEWLRVRKDGCDLVLTLEPNGTGEERTFKVGMASGDFYFYLNGTQAG